MEICFLLVQLPVPLENPFRTKPLYTGNNNELRDEKLTTVGKLKLAIENMVLSKLTRYSVISIGLIER